MIGRWERRAPEVAELIRQAFLRGISTRGVGRVIALVTEEAVSAQTVSRLTRVLDRQVEAFHQARLDDHWAYLILDGVWMKVRRAWGPQRVLLLVAYGVRPNGGRGPPGGAGLAAALQTVYPRALHQRCWVHKMRNICEAVRRRDHDRVKHDAQKIYQAPSLAAAREAFRHFQRH